MNDEIINGMIEAEKQRGSMLPDAVIAEYRALDFRPRVPHIPPMQTIEISAKQPENKEVLSVEVKRVLIVAPVVTVCGIIAANGTVIAGIIAAAVAPVAAVVVGVCGVGFLISCLKGSGTAEVKSGAKQEVHYHYHQYNNQGCGPQNNA